MPFFDSPEQKIEAQMNAGREKLRMAKAKRAGSVPTRLSNKDVLKLTEAGIQEVLEATMDLNKLKAAQSTDESQ